MYFGGLLALFLCAQDVSCAAAAGHDVGLRLLAVLRWYDWKRVRRGQWWVTKDNAVDTMQNMLRRRGSVWHSGRNSTTHVCIAIVPRSRQRRGDVYPRECGVHGTWLVMDILAGKAR